MTILKRIAYLAVLLMGISGVASAQTATTQTNLSLALSATSQTVSLASATNVTAGSELVIDNETVVVTSVSGTTATVQRGQYGTLAVAHPLLGIVWVSPAATAANPNSAFIDTDPRGTCTAAQQPYLPAVNRRNGTVWACPNGKWAGYEFRPQDGQSMPRTPVAGGNYTILASDYLVAFTTVTGNITVTLPYPGGLEGHVIIVKDEGGQLLANTTTITFSGSVDGSTTTRMTTAFGSTRLYSNGTNWFSW